MLMVTFTEEILSGKLHFLCRDISIKELLKANQNLEKPNPVVIRTLLFNFLPF